MQLHANYAGSCPEADMAYMAVRRQAARTILASDRESWHLTSMVFCRCHNPQL